jgi:hypothetical protein
MGELPRRKNTTFKTRRKFEIKHEVVVYQLTIEIEEESMHDNLLHMHDGQVCRLDNYQMKVKKVQIYFLFKMWKKDYLVYAVHKS